MQSKAPGRRAKKRAPRSRPSGELSNREALLQAAILEFSQKGYEGATTVGIAKAARLAQPMVFRHFGTKDKLWDATIERVMKPLAEMGSSVFDGLKDLEPQIRLKFLLRQFVLVSARYPEIARIMVREGVSDGPRLKHLVAKYVRPLVIPLEATAEQGIADGWLKPLDLHQLLFVIIGGATHFFNVPGLAKELFKTNCDDPTRAEKHADTLVETIFSGILRSTQTAPSAKKR